MVDELHELSDIHEPSTCTYLCSPKCRIQCVDQLVGFEKNYKSFNSINDSKWSQICTDNCYVITIKDIKTFIYT